METVKLDNYNSEWKIVFNQFEEDIRRLGSGVIEDIAHIGSTSLDKTKAKNIIDVQLAILSFDDITPLKLLLASLGLEYIDSFKQDHVPFHDVDYFEPGWEKRFFRGTYKDQKFNVHVRLKESKNWKFALAFKKYLNENRSANYAFMQFKERLANTGMPLKDYCLIKDSVIDLLSLNFD